MIKDKDIRFKYILDNLDFFKTGIFINEYSLNKERVVDFACFKDGKFYGYEIKSEADNLIRLVGQLRKYVRFFNYVYLIIFNNHLEDTVKLLNKFKLKNVGIISVDSNLEFTEYKKALSENDNFKLRGLLENLKQENLVNLIEAKQIPVPDKISKNLLISKLTGKVNLYEVIEELNNCLINNYVYKCPKCSSSLTYKTKVVETKQIKSYKFNKNNTTQKIIKNQDLVFNCHKCIECDNIFNKTNGKVRK